MCTAESTQKAWEDRGIQCFQLLSGCGQERCIAFPVFMVCCSGCFYVVTAALKFQVLLPPPCHDPILRSTGNTQKLHAENFIVFKQTVNNGSLSCLSEEHHLLWHSVKQIEMRKISEKMGHMGDSNATVTTEAREVRDYTLFSLNSFSPFLIFSGLHVSATEQTVQLSCLLRYENEQCFLACSSLGSDLKRFSMYFQRCPWKCTLTGQKTETILNVY